MAKRRSRKPSEPEIVRRDGALCVTFVNTVSSKRRPLETYADLLAWGRQSGALDASRAERLGRLAGAEPDQARAVVTRAVTFRSCLLRIFQAFADGRTPVDLDLDVIHRGTYEALAHRRLIADGGGGCRIVWNDDEELDRMLWPVLTSATWALTSKYCRRIRECAGEGCSLWFLDRTPGSPRKWCSQESCGQRIRARKYYRTTVKPMMEEFKRREAERDRRRES